MANRPRPTHRFADEAVSKIVNEYGLASVMGCLRHLYGVGAVMDAVTYMPNVEYVKLSTEGLEEGDHAE